MRVPVTNLGQAAKARMSISPRQERDGDTSEEFESCEAGTSLVVFSLGIQHRPVGKPTGMDQDAIVVEEAEEGESYEGSREGEGGEIAAAGDYMY